ncbi:unnamed protein product [Cuscuta campestris]|uniref:Uncharacterized protein n=1 Tax=Cuscuta campestris TaxID=132261 RepID=A0A484LZF5_9ASTE|nr:unnamed protein product [Cuscuta campestris]
MVSEPTRSGGLVKPAVTNVAVTNVARGLSNQELRNVKPKGKKQLLALPPDPVRPEEVGEISDAPEALGASGPHVVHPQEPVGVGVYVQEAPPHGERHLREVEAVRLAHAQRVEPLVPVGVLAHEVDRPVVVVGQRDLDVGEEGRLQAVVVHKLLLEYSLSAMARSSFSGRAVDDEENDFVTELPPDLNSRMLVRLRNGSFRVKKCLFNDLME